MGKRTKEQKERVNDKHCFFCFKLRTAILLSICTSLIILVISGYESWFDKTIRSDDPARYYMYIVIIGIEFIITSIGWIGIYNHLRAITKYFNYYIIGHILVIAIIFLVQNDYRIGGLIFFGLWFFFQILILILLFKYKSLLKIVYGWGDDPEEEEEEEEEEDIEIQEPMKEEPKKENNAQVNVSINLKMAQPQNMYQQPQMMNQPIGYRNNSNQQPQDPNYPHLPNEHNNALNVIQNNPPKVKHNNNIAQHENIEDEQNRNRARSYKLSDVAQQADPPPLGDDTDDEDEMYQNPVNQKQQLHQNLNQAENQMYNTNEWGPNQTQQTGGDHQEGGEGNDNINQQNQTNNAQFVATSNPQPPPLAYGNNNDEHKIQEDDESDNDVLADNFIVDANPDLHKKQTKGLDNLHFLDPGKNGTKGM